MDRPNLHGSLLPSPPHLFLAMAVRCPPPARQDLDAAACGSLDWDAVGDLAVRQGLGPLAFWCLQDAAALDVLPERVAADWRDAFELTRARNALLLSETERLLHAFEAASIPVSCLKGALFAETIYPHPATRPMTDIDLLVRPRDVARAAQIIHERGYCHAPTAGLDRVYVRGSSQGVQPFDAVVELHHDLLTGQVRNRKVARLRLDQLWAEAIPAQVGAARCSALGPEHSVLFLAAHMAVHHGQFRILWLADLAYYLLRGPAVNWARLVEQAQRYGLRRATGWSLRLAGDLLGAPVPPHVVAELGAAGPPTGARRAIILTSLGIGTPDGLGRDASLVARAAFLDSRWDRLRYLAAMGLGGAKEGRPASAEATHRGRPSLWQLSLRFVRASRAIRRFGA